MVGERTIFNLSDYSPSTAVVPVGLGSISDTTGRERVVPEQSAYDLYLQYLPYSSYRTNRRMDADGQLWGDRIVNDPTNVDPSGYVHTVETVLTQLVDPAPPWEKVAFVEYLVNSHAVMSSDHPFYQFVNDTFQRAVTMARADNHPNFPEGPIDLLIVDSDDPAIICHPDMRLVVMSVSTVHLMARRDLLTPSALGVILGHELRHMGQKDTKLLPVEREYDADYSSIRYASAIGLNPFGAIDIFRWLRAEYPEMASGRTDYLRTHPEANRRIAFAVAANAIPRRGQDVPLDGFPIALPGDSLARALPNEIAAITHYDEANLCDLIDRSTNLSQLLLLGRRMQELIIQDVAEALYRSIPWEHLFMVGNLADLEMEPVEQATLQRAFPGIPDPAPQELSLYFSSELPDWIPEHVRTNVANESPASYRERARRESDLANANLIRTPFMWFLHHNLIPHSLFPPGVDLSAHDQLHDSLSLEQMTEILYRMAWQLAYKQATIALKDLTSPMRSWSVDSPPPVHLRVQLVQDTLPRTHGEDVHDKVSAGITMETGQIVRRELDRMDSIRHHLEARWRTLLTEEHQVSADASQDLYLTLYAGPMVGEQYDLAQRRTALLTDWAQRFPEFSELISRFNQNYYHESLSTLLARMLNTDESYVTNPELENIQIYVGSPHKVWGQSPYAFRAIHYEENKIGHCGKRVSAQSVEASLKNLEVSIAVNQEIPPAKRGTLQSAVTRFWGALTEFTEIIHGNNENTAIPLDDLRPFPSTPGYAPYRRLRDHQLTRTLYLNAATDVGNAVVSSLSGLQISRDSGDLTHLTHLLHQYMLIDEVQHVIARDPLTSILDPTDIVVGVFRVNNHSPEVKALTQKIVEKVTSVENAAPIVDYVMQLPSDRRYDLWGFIVHSISGSRIMDPATHREKTVLSTDEALVLRRFEEAAAAVLAQDPKLYETAIDQLYRIGSLVPANPVQIQGMLEAKYGPEFEKLRRGTMTIKDFFNNVSEELAKDISYYGGEIIDPFIENHPYLSARFPLKIPERYDGIRPRAQMRFSDDLLRSVESHFFALYPGEKQDTPETNKKRFDEFLYPFVFGPKPKKKFETLGEAVFYALSNSPVYFSQENFKAALHIIMKYELQMDRNRSEHANARNYLDKVHKAYVSGIERQARQLVGRTPTPDEIKTTAFQGVAHQTNLNLLSYLRVFATRSDEYRYGAISLSQLLEKENRDFYYYLVEEMPYFNLKRAVSSYDPKVQDFTPRYEGGFSFSTQGTQNYYFDLQLEYWNKQLNRSVSSPTRLRALAEQARVAFEVVPYQVSYDLRRKPIGYSNSHLRIRGMADWLRDSPRTYGEYVASYREHVRDAYRRSRMSDIFLEHSEAEFGRSCNALPSSRTNWGRLNEYMTKVARDIQKAKISTAEKIELALKFFPHPCLDRDQLLYSLYLEIPAHDDTTEHWRMVSQLTSSFLTQYRATQIGNREFNTWFKNQDEARLRALGVDGAITVLTACYPIAGYARDDAIDLLLNGYANRPIAWIDNFADFEKLYALKTDLAPKQRDKIGIPRDLTNVMYLTDLFEGLSLEDKTEVFFWILGRADEIPLSFMEASLMSRIPNHDLVWMRNGLELDRFFTLAQNFRRDSAENAGEHFETLPKIVREANKKTFIALVVSLLDGAKGLLSPETAEAFLSEFLPQFGLGTLPQSWRQFFISFILSKDQQEAAFILAELVRRMTGNDHDLTQDEALGLFITVGGFETMKLAQIASQQSDLIGDDDLRSKLSEFQSLKEEGNREEAFLHLRLWAEDVDIPVNKIRLGRLIARASTAQVYELGITQDDGTKKIYAAKIILQRNRYQVKQRITDLQSTIDSFIKKRDELVEVPDYLFDSVREETHLELSLRHEAGALGRMGESLSAFYDDSYPVILRAPVVEDQLSTNTVLLMENVDDSITLKDLIDQRNATAQGGTVIDSTIEELLPHVDDIIFCCRNAWFAQAIRYGYTHGDLHPGNILVKKEKKHGKVIAYWIDAPNMKHLSPLAKPRHVVLAASAASLRMTADTMREAVISALSGEIPGISATTIQSLMGSLMPSDGAHLSGELGLLVQALIMNSGEFQSRLLRALALLHPNMAPDDIQSAFEATALWADSHSDSSIVQVYQRFIVELAKKKDSPEIREDLSFMTGALRATTVLTSIHQNHSSPVVTEGGAIDLSSAGTTSRTKTSQSSIHDISDTPKASITSSAMMMTNTEIVSLARPSSTMISSGIQTRADFDARFGDQVIAWGSTVPVLNPQQAPFLELVEDQDESPQIPRLVELASQLAEINPTEALAFVREHAEEILTYVDADNLINDLNLYTRLQDGDQIAALKRLETQLGANNRRVFLALCALVNVTITNPDLTPNVLLKLSPPASAGSFGAASPMAANNNFYYNGATNVIPLSSHTSFQTYRAPVTVGR